METNTKLHLETQADVNADKANAPLLSINALNVYFRRSGGIDEGGRAPIDAGHAGGHEGGRAPIDRGHAPEVRVVENLSLDVGPSEVVGIAGESGCGKSVTAYSVMGILPKSARSTGGVVFDGTDLRSAGAETLRRLRGDRMAMVFQEPMTSLNPVLTVGYQIAEVLTTHKGMSKRDAMSEVFKLLEDVKIPEARARARDYPHRFSGGMRQRVMIAMAMACNPSLLIADEPTTALDVTIQSQILALLRSTVEKKRMSMLLITHDLGIIAENTQRAAVMYAGRIMEQSGTQELFKTPLHPYTIGLLESLPKGRGVPLRPILGIVPRPGELPAGCKFSNRCAHKIPRCEEEEPVLRDYGGGHTVRCHRAGEVRWEF
jgi:oligopeptide/dipeptide ABC transporter ATP-binding protein